MSRGCRSHLVFSGIIVWSMAIFRVSDGGSITWFDPPPFETVTDSAIISAVNKTLIKGFSDEELSCNFSLTADLSLITVSMKYAASTIATYLQSQQALSVEPTFVSRLNATWVPNKLSLILFSATDADKGEYRCEVVTFGGSVQTWIRKIQVSLLVPSIITNITGKTVKERGNVTLKCLADGTPPIRITWTRLSDNTTVIMPLINISRHDVRDYRCTADNGVGTPATTDVSIDVQYPPEVNGSGQNATVATDVEHTFSCPVDGNPTPIITWYSETGAHSGKQFRTGQKGCYICVARNALGISDNITQCLIINSSLPTVPPTTERSQTMVSSITPSQRQEIRAILTIVTNYEEAFKDLNSTSSKEFVAKFVQEMDKVYMDMPQYIGTKVTQLRPGNVIVYFILYFKTPVTAKKGLENLRVAISSNGTFGDFQAKDLVLFSEKSAESTKTTGPSSSSTAGPKAGPPWIIIIAVAGGVVLLAILVGVLTWWVHKQRKCRKATKIHDSDLGRHDSEGGYSQVQGAYAHSGPPAANGADGTDEQEIEVTGAIPTYAVVDKSKRSKTQVNEKPPEYAVVDKSKKKEKQEATAIPTYAAVDKSKGRKKSREEVLPPVYAEVEKSKKKKKNIDDKNLKGTLDEPKKEKKPGELLYADLGDFQNPGMPTVPISPQPLPAIKKADPYERTDYADITQFLKGNATLPPNDGNGDTEMKPKRPSKKKIQGNDKETPI